MRRVLLLAVAVILAVAIWEAWPRGSSIEEPVRTAAVVAPPRYAHIYITDEHGNPLPAEIAYALGGKQISVEESNGIIRIPENAEYAIISAKGRIPVKIRAISDGRTVILPKNPLTIRRVLKLSGCTYAFIAPVGAPLVNKIPCNTKISLPQGVYQYVALGQEGCIAGVGAVTLREDKNIAVGKNGKCEPHSVKIVSAETGNETNAWVTVFEGNVTYAFACKGLCTVGGCADVYAWKPAYMRAYAKVCEGNAEITMNRAVDVETVHIKTDGNAIAITDRSGVLIYYANRGDAKVTLPDGSYYVYAERGPEVVRTFLRVPGTRELNLNITPGNASLQLLAGEVAYVDDAPVCRGPKTCNVPALTAIRVVGPGNKSKVVVLLPGEQRII